LLKAFSSSNRNTRGGPFVPTLLTAEEIDPLITIKDFKEVAGRKSFSALHTWKFHACNSLFTTMTLNSVPMQA
jgi:hypothetical protein